MDLKECRFLFYKAEAVTFIDWQVIKKIDLYLLKYQSKEFNMDSQKFSVDYRSMSNFELIGFDIHSVTYCKHFTSSH